MYRRNAVAISELDLSFIYHNAGITHLELGEYEQALEKCNLELSLINEKENPQAYSNAIELMAMIHGDQEAYGEAFALLDRVVRIRRNHLTNAESYKNLAL